MQHTTQENSLINSFVDDLLSDQDLYRRQLLIDNIINSHDLSEDDRIEIMIRFSHDILNRMTELLEYKIISDSGLFLNFFRIFFIDSLYEYMFGKLDKVPILFNKYSSYAASIKALNTVLTILRYRKFYSQISKILLPNVNS